MRRGCLRPNGSWNRPARTLAPRCAGQSGGTKAPAARPAARTRQIPLTFESVLAAGPPGIGDQVHADAVAQRLRDALTLAGLAEPEVCVRVVGHLDRQPDSGKLSRFVPLAAP